jgi:hypothetical protein
MNGIKILEYPRLPNELFVRHQEIPREITRQLGVSDYQQAVMPDEKRLQVEVMAIQETGGARTTGAAKEYRLFKGDVAACMLGLIQLFAKRYRKFSYASPDGKMRWGAMKHTELKGFDTKHKPLPVGIQFRIKLDIDSSAPRSKVLDQRLQMELLNILIPLVPQLIDPITQTPRIDLMPIITKVVNLMGHRFSGVVRPEPSEDDKVAVLLQKLLQSGQLIEELGQVVEQLKAENEQVKAENQEISAEAERVQKEAESIASESAAAQLERMIEERLQQIQPTSERS